MSVKEVMAELGVHISTVYRLVAYGKLPAYRVGRRVLIERVALEAFLEERRVVVPEMPGRF